MHAAVSLPQILLVAVPYRTRVQQLPSAPPDNARPPLHAPPPPPPPNAATTGWRLCAPASANCVDGNTMSLLPELVSEQLSGESTAADEGVMVAQAAAGTTEQVGLMAIIWKFVY
ncbi:hypothetical protein BS78_06G055500 [Paspalum vaginatum]|nr:hypothetical protein BS78_06G055500 [Paspalum vaginatum]